MYCKSTFYKLFMDEDYIESLCERQVNICFNYKQLVKSAFAIHKDDFYNLYISIEERNAKENKNFEPWSYKYNFLKPNCYLVVECNENGNAKFFLNVNNQTYIFGGKERSVRELVNESEVFQSVMEENHLNFCPKYSEEFKKAILSADKGTIIMLNTKRMIICVGENEKQLFFKDCFSLNYEQRGAFYG